MSVLFKSETDLILIIFTCHRLCKHELEVHLVVLSRNRVIEFFVLQFPSVIPLLSSVFSQLLHFVSWVNENHHKCHSLNGHVFYTRNNFKQQCKVIEHV